jgi:two-component system, OmpR family, KDP operon response regulator KdpE
MGQNLQKPPGNAGPSVLLADDEEAIRRVLRAQLTARGYQVDEASTGQEVLEKTALRQPDVVLLDLGLPDIDGIEVTRLLRQRSEVPVIILSVRAGETDKIAALDAGADNYLTKPCQPSELLERIRSALLREATLGMHTFHAGDLAVDLDQHAVQLGDRPIQLTSTEFDLLRVLVLNAGRLLTASRLSHEAWSEKHDEEALQLLRTTIGSLRRKLETNPARPRHITTEPGVGFRLRTEA